MGELALDKCQRTVAVKRGFWSFAAALGTAFVLLASGASARDPSAPLSAYGRLPYLEDVALSPDGTRLAYVMTTDDARDLYITESSGKLLGGAGVGKAKLRGVMWQDNDNVLVFTSITSAPPMGFSGSVREWYEVVKYIVSEKKLHPFNFEVKGERTFNVITGRLTVREIDGKSVVFVPGYYVSGSVLPALFSFRGDTGTVRIVARGDEPATNWLLDEAGRIAVQLEYHDPQKTWTIRAHRDNHMVSIATGSAPIDPPRLLGFDATGEQAIVEFMQDGDPIWRPISLKDGVLGEPLDHGAALHGVITDPRNSRIVGGVLNRDDRKYVFFDNELQAHWDAVLRAFPKDVVHLVSHSADFSKMILEVFGPENGFQYAYFDWYTHGAHLLGPRYKGVTQAAEVRKITYPAGDGLAISAFLTVPRDLPQNNLPLIVLPHGGPAAQDTLGCGRARQRCAEGDLTHRSSAWSYCTDSLDSRARRYRCAL
jgi:dipeptidyl aminopeptidase/acylaminoacyl peptidase